MTVKIYHAILLIVALLQCTGGRKENTFISYLAGFGGVPVQSRAPAPLITIRAEATIDDVVKEVLGWL